MKKSLVLILLVFVGTGLGPGSHAAAPLVEAARFTDLGFAALERGQSVKAQKLFTRALKRVPSFPSAHRGLGDLAMEQGRLPDAVSEYRAQRAGFPNADAVPSAAHFLVGLALSESGLWAEAIAAYELGLAADPDFAEAHYRLALAHWNAGRIVEAGRSLARAEELGFEVRPSFAVQLADAIDDSTPPADAPTTTDPDGDWLAFQTDVTEVLEEDDYVAALRMIDAYLASALDDPAVRTLRADVLARMGSHAHAETDLLRALELAPDSYDAQYQMAALYRATGRPLLALQGLRILAGHAEEPALRAKLLLNIAQLEWDTGNPAAAMAAFEQAVMADSSLAPLVTAELANRSAESTETPNVEE